MPGRKSVDIHFIGTNAHDKNDFFLHGSASVAILQRKKNMLQQQNYANDPIIIVLFYLLFRPFHVHVHQSWRQLFWERLICMLKLAVI